MNYDAMTYPELKRLYDKNPSDLLARLLAERRKESIGDRWEREFKSGRYPANKRHGDQA